MAGIRQYLLSVTAAAVFCGIVKSLFGKKKGLKAIGGLLAGLFLAVTVISPLTGVEIGELGHFSGSLRGEGERAARAGQEAARKSAEAIIKTRVETYILNKAADRGADLKVRVTMGDGTFLEPRAVRLEGKISPYNRQRLEKIIAEELGIPREAQTWIG